MGLGDQNIFYLMRMKFFDRKNKAQKILIYAGLAWLIIFCPLVFGLAQTNTDTASGARIKLSSVVIPLYDEDNNLKARFSGENTELIAGTKQTKVSEFKLELIRPGSKSEVELEISAAEGFYDSKTAHSPGDIEMKSGDGQFLVRGQGFSWDIQNGALVITNHIETILKPSFFDDKYSGDKTDSSVGFVGDWKEIKELNIHSETLVYSIPTAVAKYKRSVNAFDGEKLNLEAGVLTLKLRPDVDELDQLVVEKNVRVSLQQDTRRYEISSGKALYRRFGDGNEVLVFSEDLPSWKTFDGVGKGEKLSFFLPEKRVEVEGNASAQVSIPDKTKSVFLTKFGGTPILGDSIDVECDAYIFENNRLLLSGIKNIVSGETNINTDSVRISLDEGFQARSLAAGPRFTLSGYAKNVPFKISGNDLILNGLSSEEPRAEVQRNAQWFYGGHSGGGDTLIIELIDLAINCQGLAFAKLQVSDWIDNPDYQFPVDIKCAKYTFQNKSIVLNGQVRVSHPKWQMVASKVDLTLEGDSNQIKTIHAQNNVSMEAQFQINNEKQASKRLTRFLGGLIEEGVPWKVFCGSLQLEINNEEALVKSFTALSNVRLMRAGNTGQGQKLEMLPDSKKVELTIRPSFTMASGTTLKGEKGTVFSWDMEKNSVKVSQGHYSVILPSKVFVK